MSPDTSECNEHFGHQDFDPAWLSESSVARCPVVGCSAKLSFVLQGKNQLPYCCEHGLRLHSKTFVYWNGPTRADQARLRNFRFQPELAREVILNSSQKAESHRLGHEMSEDALSWNVFVAIAAAEKLRVAARFL